MKLKLAIRELHRSERKLAHELNVVAARHHSDQDISHLAQDLAGWSRHHLAELARHGRHYGLRLSSDPAPARSPVSCNRGSAACCGTGPSRG